VLQKIESLARVRPAALKVLGRIADALLQQPPLARTGTAPELARAVFLQGRHPADRE